MKCPNCKYEHEGEWGSNGYINTTGDEKFIEIYVEYKVKIDNPEKYHKGDYDYQDKIEISLVACPKCKTVILDM